MINRPGKPTSFMDSSCRRAGPGTHAGNRDGATAARNLQRSAQNPLPDARCVEGCRRARKQCGNWARRGATSGQWPTCRSHPRTIVARGHDSTMPHSSVSNITVQNLCPALTRNGASRVSDIRGATVFPGGAYPISLAVTKQARTWVPRPCVCQRNESAALRRERAPFRRLVNTLVERTWRRLLR